MTKRINAFTIDNGPQRLFVTDCASCGVVFAMSVELEQRRRKDHRQFFCPNGHTMVFNGPTQAEKDAKAARERADRLSHALRAERDQADAARREAAMVKASEIRIRWRVGNGVCPCCQRSFTALAAHVATKHPEFVHHDLEALSTRMRELLATMRRELEATDGAVLDAEAIGAHMGTVRALANRGLVDQIDYHRIALTEAGWPLAEQAAGAHR